MAIFNSYVSLPEGKISLIFWMWHVTIFHDVWNAQLEKPRHFYQRCTNVWIRKVILIFHGSIFMFSHMRTMVLEYAHLHHWVIVWVNDGKYTSTMVRIWVYENSLYSCFFFHLFSPLSIGIKFWAHQGPSLKWDILGRQLRKLSVALWRALALRVQELEGTRTVSNHTRLMQLVMQHDETGCSMIFMDFPSSYGIMGYPCDLGKLHSLDPMFGSWHRLKRRGKTGALSWRLGKTQEKFHGEDIVKTWG